MQFRKGPLQDSEMCTYAWFDFHIEIWSAALTWGSVTVDLASATVLTGSLCQSIAPEGVSSFIFA